MKRAGMPLIVFASLVALFGAGCEYLNFDPMSEIPTKSRMEGVWEVTEAYDSSGASILQKINFPVTAFYLSSDNTIVSTAGPTCMYLVYGGGEYTKIASRIDQVFNYAALDFNGGEWFIDGGPAERFTLEMKLEGLPGQKSITDLLDLIGIGKDYLDLVIYHKFRDVQVSFPDSSDSLMAWEFDDVTSAVYNKKDKYGDYVFWRGWPTSSFSHCQFVLRKRSKDLKELVLNAAR